VNHTLIDRTYVGLNSPHFNMARPSYMIVAAWKGGDCAGLFKANATKLIDFVNLPKKGTSRC
jgi:hypothetical protein